MSKAEQIQTCEDQKSKWPKKFQKKLRRLLREWEIAKAAKAGGGDPGELEKIRIRLFRETLELMYDLADDSQSSPARADERVTRL